MAGFELLIGQKQCSWTVTANDGQNIRIQVQDIKLDSYRMKCVSSYILITDRYGKHEYKICGNSKGEGFVDRVLHKCTQLTENLTL